MASLPDVTQTRAPSAHAICTQKVETPEPPPVTRIRRPGAAPAQVTVARHAVRPARGKAAASSQLRAGGFEWTLRAATTTRSANVPSVGEPRMSNAADAARSSSPHASAGSITTSSPDGDSRDAGAECRYAARAVRTERHGHGRRGLAPDPPVAAVEGRRHELDDDLARSGHGVGEVLDLEAGLARVGERKAGCTHARHRDGYDRAVSGSSLRALVADLVAIDSVNPDLVPGGAGEMEIARFIAGWLERAGAEVRIDEVAPGRANVIGVARGRGGGRVLLLNGHTDTVGHEGYERPLEPRVEGDRLYGRGGFDMKGGVAAALWACAQAVPLGLAGDVVVAAVCDEEFASIGTQALARDVRADAAIVTEPTDLEVCVAHKGFAWLEVEVAGRAAHGSQPQLGIDAIAKCGRVLTGIEELGRRLVAEPGHPVLGAGSVHASLIEGGQELSSYPERCLVQLERRTVPGESAELVEAQVRELVAEPRRRIPVCAPRCARRSCARPSRSAPTPRSCASCGRAPSARWASRRR